MSANNNNRLPTIEEFEKVVSNIMSPDNTVRQNAETIYNSSKNEPDFCVSALTRLLRFSQDPKVRELSCILLRKNITNTEESLYSKISNEVKSMVKKELISALEAEQVASIRKKLSYAMAGLASGLIENGEYPELLPAMFTWTKSTNPSHRESALAIFNQLATFLLDKGLAPYLPSLKIIFANCLADPDSKKVRIAAVEATASVILVLDNKQNRLLFQELIPNILQALASSLNESDVDGAAIAIESLIDIAEGQPEFFRPHIATVISAMYTIASTANLDDSVRHLGMEFMLTITEAAPKMMRKVTSFIQNLFPLCMELMLEIDDEDEEWNTSLEDEEETDMTSYDVALDALDRISITLGGKQVQPVAFSVIPKYLNSTDWKHRHAGLMALAQTAEGCIRQYETHLAQIVMMVLAHYRDAHPRVRYAAIHCTAQLASDFAPDFQATFHSQIMPAIIASMDDPIPRVQCHAATATVNFVDECEVEFMEPYLDALITKLLTLLEKGMRFVQEQTLSAISAVASSSTSHFVKYYSATIKYLKLILANANGKQERMLRAKAMECISLIGVAVGPETFKNDAIEVMDVLVKTQSSTMEADDPQASYLLQAWTRIAKCLGPEFVPYLDLVMPSLLNSANQKAEVIVTDADEASTEDEEGMESITLSIKGVGDKRISIRTSTLEDKALACSMLYSYAYELKDAFLPYVDKVSQVIIPLLKFAYYEEIRETSATILPLLLNSIKLSAEKGKAPHSLIKQFFDFAFTPLIQALKIEPEPKTLSVQIESLNDMIKNIGSPILDSQQMDMFTQVYNEVLSVTLERRQEIKKMINEEQEEEEPAEGDDEEVPINEEEVLTDEVLSALAESSGTLMKTHPTFIPLFVTSLWPIFSSMMDTKMDAPEKRVGLCALCDLVEQGKEHAKPFASLMIRACLAYAVDQDPDVRQAAVYGVGSCCQHLGDDFNPFVENAITALITAIKMESAKEETDVAATANAVSSLYKIIEGRANHPAVNPNVLLPVWLDSLPIEGDTLEACAMHKALVAHVKQGNALIIGDNNANIPKIVKIFAYVLDTDFVDEETQTNMINILKAMQTQIPPNILQQAWAGLEKEEREKVQKLVSQ